jgi:hypothetical protein
MSVPFRYDWEGAIARINEAGEEPASFCLYCLPKAGVLLLAALLERARWRATFRLGGVDLSPEVWEQVQDIVDDTEIGLMANCDAFIENIVTQVTNSVTNRIQFTNNYGDLCCYMDATENGLDPNPPSETPPGNTDDRRARCARAQQAHEAMLTVMTQSLDKAEILGGFSSGVLVAILLAVFNVAALPAILIGGFVAAIVAILANDETTELQLQWAAIGHDVACCITWNDSPEIAQNCIYEVIETNVSGSAIVDMFRIMYNMDMINDIWDGTDVLDGVGYDDEYCDDCVAGEAIAMRFTVDDFFTNQSSPAGAGWNWNTVIADDLIRGGSQVAWSDIDDEAETPKTVLIYDEREISDPTTIPEYSATWRVQGGSTGGFDAAFANTRLYCGLQTKTSGSTFQWSAITSGYQVLVRRLDGTLIWVDATLTQVTTVPGCSITASGISYALQDYAPGTLNHLVQVDLDWPALELP